MMRYLILLVVILLIISRYYLTRPEFTDGQKVRVTTTVSADPARYSNYQIVKISNFSVKLPLFPEVEYKDRLVVEGTVKDDSYLDDAKIISQSSSTSFLIQIRKKIIKVYQSSLPEPYAAFLAGTTLGVKSSLPTDFLQKLKNTGTAHVVVASGMNVTLVAGFLMNLLVGTFIRSKAIIFSLMAIWLYVFMVGFEAPIVRAAIMGSIAFSAQGLGRLSSAFRALIVSALVMLIYKPAWIFDISFLLSFFATLSLMVFQKHIEKRIMFIPGFFREGLSTSLAAQIGVAPILYYTFGQFNIFSPLINALVLWTISYITIGGIIAGALGLFWLDLAKIVIWLIYPFLWWFVLVVEKFG